MATIDEDNDIYNGGGGGGGSIDPDSIPDNTNIFLGTNNWCDANGIPEKAWFQQPIAMKMVSSGANRIWTLALRKYYDFGAVNQPPALIHGSNSQTKSKYFSLNFESYFNNQNHQASRDFLLLDLNLMVNSDNGKFLKLVKVGGGYWDFALDTPSSTPELFEVYIDEDNASNNRNVVYNDILNAVNSGKYVYLVVNRSGEKSVYTIQTCHSSDGIVFSCFNAAGIHHCVYNTYLISNSNSYSHASNPLVPTQALIDESQSPVVLSYINFTDLKYWYNKGYDNEIILTYINSNGYKYKLRAIKLTATEIMFSIYDPDTARNLSIVVNDQDQYTVIT